MNSGRNEEALSDFSKTIEIDPEFVLAYNLNIGSESWWKIQLVYKIYKQLLNLMIKLKNIQFII